jgi:hypothetical protein
MTHTFRSKVLVYPGFAAWRFLYVPTKDSEKLGTKYGANARGWGSLPVDATIGKTKWKTSIFPDKRSGCYLLPLKAAVRKAEQIDDEDTVRFSIVVRI